MNTFTKIRILLQPWWAKLCTVILLMFFMGVWYAVYVYVGWSDEQRIHAHLTETTNNVFIKEDNMFPDWLEEFDLGINQFGKRTTMLQLYSEQLTGEHFKQISKLKHLKNLNLVFEDRPSSDNPFVLTSYVATNGCLAKLCDCKQFQTLDIKALRISVEDAKVLHDLKVETTLHLDHYDPEVVKALEGNERITLK